MTFESNTQWILFPFECAVFVIENLWLVKYNCSLYNYGLHKPVTENSAFQRK